jgi:hypothetical protein
VIYKTGEWVAQLSQPCLVGRVTENLVDKIIYVEFCGLHSPDMSWVTQRLTEELRPATPEEAEREIARRMLGLLAR